MFEKCKLLSSLPDISKWNSLEIFDMRYLFSNCISLVFIPNISKWNIPINARRDYMYQNCLSLSYIAIQENEHKKSNCINSIN